MAGAGSMPSMPPPRPKSPPQYPDLYGKRREFAKVQMLEREIGFLEEELKSIEGLHPASRSCKEVTEFVLEHSDPLIPTIKKTRRSRCFWKWLCREICAREMFSSLVISALMKCVIFSSRKITIKSGSSCFNLSWICCWCRCPSMKMPNCCCNCNLCNCCPSISCSIPKCCCQCFSCPRSKCCRKPVCKWSCCSLKCPSCFSCSSCSNPCTCTCSCSYPRCPKLNCTSCCKKCCCFCPCYLC